MPKTTDIRSKRTRQALQEALFTLLKTNDFEEITINDLCNCAAVSRTTFYMHYQDKFDLTSDSIYQLVTPLNEYLYKVDLETFFRHILAAVRKNHTIIKRLRKISGTMELKWMIDKLFLQGFTEYYQYRESQGAVYSAPAEVLAVYNCNGTMNLILWWHANDYQISEDDMINYLLNCLPTN